MSEPISLDSQSPLVALIVLADVDPHDVRSDAHAQVIEHEIRRRLHGATLAIDFRSVVDPVDPRRRSRWKPARGTAWGRTTAEIVDIGSTASMLGDIDATHIPVPDVSGWFADLIDPAALETRRLMLAHLGITEPTGSLGLTATDHVALGKLAAERVEASDQSAASKAFDRIAELVTAAAPSPPIDHLVGQIESLRSELSVLRADQAAWEHATQVELERRAHAVRALELRVDRVERPS